MIVNLSFSDEVNEERLKLGATWREVFIAGLNVLKGQPNIIAHPLPVNTSPIEISMEKHIKGLIEDLKKLKELGAPSPATK